jgi:hypothetical protein
MGFKLRWMALARALRRRACPKSIHSGNWNVSKWIAMRRAQKR